MTNPENKHNNIYLFVVEQSLHEFAKFGKIHKRRAPATRKEAAAEIETEAALKKWEDVKDTHDGQNLDMRFPRGAQALVFVQLPTVPSKTVFGGKGVTDLDVKRNGSKPIVMACHRYPEGSKTARLCSFEIKLGDVLRDISANEQEISRLPIMFDFVDLGEDISPVFKKPHDQLVPASLSGHGGIHPSTASSMILLD